MKTLWHGDFLDGKLSIVLPEKDDTVEKCPCCYNPAVLELAHHLIVCIIISNDFQYKKHIHLDDVAMKDIAKCLPAVFNILKEDYTTCITDKVMERLRNGEHLH